MTDAHTVRLKPKRDKRVAQGHPWVFSNEIDGDVSAIPPGGVVDVTDDKGKFLGRGYGNPASLIAVRILSRRRKEDLDHWAFYADRLREAAALRETLYPGRRSCRLVYSEGDGLPGLIVDRYGEVLSVQIGTLGLEVRKELLAEALRRALGAEHAVLRNDARVRELEGLERHRGVWFGDPPESVVFDEGGVRFEVPVLGGQKTGHFFDQYDNKRWAAPLCRGKQVLDVYSNTGGWALHALAAGAEGAICVDKDPANAALCQANAERNGFGGALQAVAAEGKATLQDMVQQGMRFGAVVLDPPAFAKQKKAAIPALKGYREIHGLGLTLLEEGGLLFASSCSYHVHEDRFLEAIRRAADDAGKRIKVLRRGEQSADHPTIPGVPETRYLKSYAIQAYSAARR